MPIACLPWYALAEMAPAQDALWAVIRRHLMRQGVEDVPLQLSRDVPIPGVFCEPDLLLGQCCGYDIVYGFADTLRLVATPRYRAPGCERTGYRSFVLVRGDHPATGLDDLRGAICAVNSFNSHSGANALRALVAPLSRGGRFFGAVKVTGAHLRSLALLDAGEADVMAIDCVLHALLAKHRPLALAGTRVLAASELAPAPPFVTSASTAPDRAGRLGAALRSAFADPDSAEARAALLLDGAEVLPIQSYARIVEVEGFALARGYFELHATSPIAGKG